MGCPSPGPPQKTETTSSVRTKGNLMQRIGFTGVGYLRSQRKEMRNQKLATDVTMTTPRLETQRWEVAVSRALEQRHSDRGWCQRGPVLGCMWGRRGVCHQEDPATTHTQSLLLLPSSLWSVFPWASPSYRAPGGTTWKMPPAGSALQCGLLGRKGMGLKVNILRISP